MSVKFTLRKFVVVVSAFGLALGAVKMVRAQSSTAILLENFATLRNNLDSPPQPLWQPYNNPSGGADYSNQTGSVTGNTYHLWTAGRPYFEFLPYPYVDPKGFAKQNILSGTWNPNVNRFRFWIKSMQSIPRRTDGGTIAEVGTYTKNDDGQPANQGAHYYHYLDNNFIAGQWMLVTLNRVPSHEVGMTDPSGSYPENPTASSGWNYYDGLTRFYFCDEYGVASVWNGDYYFADYEFDLVTGEPDTLVATVAAVYTGDHYELSWQGPRNIVQSYTVYMSPSSMKSTGVSSGTKIGTTTTTGDAYAGVFIASGSIAQPGTGMYFAIQPAGSSSFTQIYLPTGPYQGSGTTGSGAPAAPGNLRIVP